MRRTGFAAIFTAIFLLALTAFTAQSASAWTFGITVKTTCVGDKTFATFTIDNTSEPEIATVRHTNHADLVPVGTQVPKKGTLVTGSVEAPYTLTLGMNWPSDKLIRERTATALKEKKCVPATTTTTVAPTTTTTAKPTTTTTQAPTTTTTSAPTTTTTTPSTTIVKPTTTTVAPTITSTTVIKTTTTTSTTVLPVTTTAAPSTTTVLPPTTVPVSTSTTVISNPTTSTAPPSVSVSVPTSLPTQSASTPAPGPTEPPALVTQHMAKTGADFGVFALWAMALLLVGAVLLILGSRNRG